MEAMELGEAETGTAVAARAAAEVMAKVAGVMVEMVAAMAAARIPPAPARQSSADATYQAAAASRMCPPARTSP